jgi:hypothetical protein
MARVSITYCDHCGEPVWSSSRGEIKPHKDYSELPFDCDSANRGESATICHACDQWLELQKDTGGEL